MFAEYGRCNRVHLSLSSSKNSRKSYSWPLERGVCKTWVHGILVQLFMWNLCSGVILVSLLTRVEGVILLSKYNGYEWENKYSWIQRIWYTAWLDLARLQASLGAFIYFIVTMPDLTGMYSNIFLSFTLKWNKHIHKSKLVQKKQLNNKIKQ